jgi:hypothetical protein
MGVAHYISLLDEADKTALFGQEVMEEAENMDCDTHRQ